MTNRRTLLRNVGSNAVGYAINVVVAYLLLPYQQDKLGPDGAGIWTLVVSLVGYYGLLDVGIRSAVGHFVATHHSRREPEQVNRTLSTAMALMLLVATLAAVITWLVGDAGPDWCRWINRVRVERGEKPLELAGAFADPDSLRHVIWVMGAGFALSFPMALYGTVIYSVQRIGIQNAIGISQLLLRAGLTVWALEAGHGLMGLACVATGCNLLGWIASIIAAYRVLPTLALSFSRVGKAAARELFGYGGFNVLVNVGDTVLLYTSAFVIVGKLDDPRAANFYAVPATNLIPYLMQLVQSVTWSLTPHFTGKWAVGQIDDVRRLLRNSTRWVTLLAALVVGGLVFLGGDFLGQWMPSEFVDDPRFAESVQVLAVLAVATLIRCSQSAGRQVLFAMREVRYLGFLVLIEAALNVALSIWLVTRHGIVGVAVATLIPVVLMQGIVQPRHLLRELEVPAAAFAGDVLRAAIPVLLVMGGVDWLLCDQPEVRSMAGFLVRGLVVAAPAALVGLGCTMTRDERAAWWRRLRPA